VPLGARSEKNLQRRIAGNSWDLWDVALAAARRSNGKIRGGIRFVIGEANAMERAEVMMIAEVSPAFA
jgi:hypothetical protein